MMELRTTPEGLTSEDAKLRLEEFGPNEVATQKPRPKMEIIATRVSRSICLCSRIVISCFSFNRRP